MQHLNGIGAVGQPNAQLGRIAELHRLHLRQTDPHLDDLPVHQLVVHDHEFLKTRAADHHDRAVQGRARAKIQLKKLMFSQLFHANLAAHAVPRLKRIHAHAQRAASTRRPIGRKTCGNPAIGLPLDKFAPCFEIRLHRGRWCRDGR